MTLTPAGALALVEARWKQWEGLPTPTPAMNLSYATAAKLILQDLRALAALPHPVEDGRAELIERMIDHANRIDAYMAGAAGLLRIGDIGADLRKAANALSAPVQDDFVLVSRLSLTDLVQAVWTWTVTHPDGPAPNDAEAAKLIGQVLAAAPASPAPSLPHNGAEPVAVKPLEWPVMVSTRMRSVITKDSLVQYAICRVGPGTPVYRWARSGGSWSVDFEQLSDCVAAAQADYETRIKSALVLPTIAAGAVGEGREDVWYLDATDPADGAMNICDIMQDKAAGIPVEIHSAAVVAVTWHAKLPPAEEADSDDDWECEASSEAACLRLIADEKDRRAALTPASA